MAQFSRDDLIRLLREAGGVDEGVDLAGDILDDTFTDLGYDSLAILAMSTKIQQEFVVVITDEEVIELMTPRQVIDHVNRQMSQS